MDSKANDGNFHINESNEESWLKTASQLPKTININGQETETELLSDKKKKLLAIYINDSNLVGQFKELLALAELGLKSIESEISSSESDQDKKPSKKKS